MTTHGGAFTSDVGGDPGGVPSMLTEPKIGDMATVVIPTNERHIKDLWWWNGAKVVIANVDESGRCFILTNDGYQGWFDRRLLVLANEEPQP